MKAKKNYTPQRIKSYMNEINVQCFLVPIRNPVKPNCYRH